MSLLRQPILLLARSQGIKKLVSTMPVSSGIVTSYVPGEATADAVRATQGLVDDGLRVTLDHLGEDTTDAAQADATVAAYKEVLAELHEQLEHSRGIVEAQEAELSGLMRDSGDGAGQDQADLGATSFERDHELTVLNSERDKLAQIERALARIDDGTYGVCESCGNPIGKMRLMAFPRATLCMTCKQREERR